MQKPAFSVMQGAACVHDMQGIMGVFMREPLLDWQREARVVNAKHSLPAGAKTAVSASETADPADMHVNLKVYLLTGGPCLSTILCPLCDCSLHHSSPQCLQLCLGTL